MINIKLSSIVLFVTLLFAFQASWAHPAPHNSTHHKKKTSVLYTKTISGYEGAFVTAAADFCFASLGVLTVFFLTNNFEKNRVKEDLTISARAIKNPMQTLGIAIGTFQAIRLTYAGFLKITEGIGKYHTRKDNLTPVDLTRLEHH